MSSSKDAIHGSLVVLEAVDAARNTRAITLFLGCAISALIVAGVFATAATGLVANDAVAIGLLFSGIGWLCALILVATGVSAAGKILMDQIQQRPPLSTRAALMAGLLTLPKLLGVFLIEIAAFVVFMIALAIVLLVCKIPVLGPLLYTVVYPLASVVAGMLWFTFVFIVNPLAAPAFWEGYGVRQALGVLGLNRGALNIGRLLPPIVQQLVLLLVVGVVAFIASAILFSGSAFVAALGSGIIGFRSNVYSMFSGGVGGMSGYLFATLAGVGILAALAYTFPLMVYLAGTCRIFLNLAASQAGPTGPALTATPYAPEPIGPMPTAGESDALTPPTSATQATTASHACPQCGAAAEPGDVFCGECGADLPRGA
ncbi:zinc ribbon domain-containing protein [Paraburkholderia sp. D15]|uniref:zinc ribbon domain-containing protein n=1 Tax=Paraburkholderia sp. D15 TaxID=2880218 RepID=UPI002479FE6D|nr:zinc ribbon domain-containing protein [Paraburkholderia sp. D15]WGS51730.1 zinc ribbon domain-containing protein [Paraburkholderia sp. D15]